MTALAHEQPSPEDVLLDGFLKLDTPEGFRAELIDGEIIVSPPPGGPHDEAVASVNEQIIRYSETRMRFSGTRGVEVPRGGPCPKDHVIPDGIAAPAELRLFGAHPGSWMPPDGIELVMEVTSSRPDIDRNAKRHCYARADIPLYLLIDRADRVVLLFSNPDGDEYADTHRSKFGVPIDLPSPFGFTLQTEDFD